MDKKSDALELNVGGVDVRHRSTEKVVGKVQLGDGRVDRSRKAREEIVGEPELAEGKVLREVWDDT